MRTPCLRHRLARLLAAVTGRTRRHSADHTGPEVPGRVDLVDDDDDLMALVRALYPERYGRKAGDAK